MFSLPKEEKEGERICDNILKSQKLKQHYVLQSITDKPSDQVLIYFRCSYELGISNKKISCLPYVTTEKITFIS